MVLVYITWKLSSRMTILLVYKIKLCFSLSYDTMRNKGWSLIWLSATALGYVSWGKVVIK